MSAPQCVVDARPGVDESKAATAVLEVVTQTTEQQHTGLIDEGDIAEIDRDSTRPAAINTSTAPRSNSTLSRSRLPRACTVPVLLSAFAEKVECQLGSAPDR